jgi:primosomal protein N' (replication factor Y)
MALGLARPWRYKVDMSTTTVVEVAVPVPVDETFDYALVDERTLEPGVRVLVPHGGRRVVGVVVASRPASSARANGAQPRRPGSLRAVLQVLDEEPVLPLALLEAVLRVAREALCPPGIALAAAIPPGTAARPGTKVALLPAGMRALERGELRGTLGQVLWALGRRARSESEIRARFPAAVAALERLERLGFVSRKPGTDPPRVRRRTERVYRVAPGLDRTRAERELARAPKQLALLQALGHAPAPARSTASLRALVEAGFVICEERELVRGPSSEPLVPSEPAPELTPHQKTALGEIGSAIEARKDAQFLLYGITGSGKTEVYQRAADVALRNGRSVIVLVPEISLTHQVVDRFRARFGDRVAVLHSGLSAGERFDQWRLIREGRVPIAIGARSAVFAPYTDLGLIVIDEEHDAAYKSDEGFRYHARDVARVRAERAGCPLVLGSATPDVGTAWRSAHGEIQRLSLPERVASRPLPTVEIVDMASPAARGARRGMLSRPLREALAETLAAGQQSILFLNRRGFAAHVYCFGCGHALRCQHCDISLVYHASEGVRRIDDPLEGELRCHYCGYREDPKSRCPSCNSPEGGMQAYGTERLDEEVSAFFPSARVGRLDRDTSKRKGAQRSILAAFHRGEIDILVGTQMVAKGHDIPNVTLVGVVAADLGLHFPDFRAGERTFQLLTQVAGRAGRGLEPGRVVLQTFLPDHYAIALARTHDYPRFYREEVARRRPHGWPPFNELVHFAFSGKRQAKVEQAAVTMAGLAKTCLQDDTGSESVRVLGPAPAPLPRLRDEFRWQLLLLGPRDGVRAVARELSRLAHGPAFAGVVVRVDVNPLQML